MQRQSKKTEGNNGGSGEGRTGEAQGLTEQLEFLIVVLAYKFGYTLEYLLSLTIPQIQILEHNLAKICRAEAGKEEDEVDKTTANSMALVGVIEMLQRETGRDRFSMDEIMDPAGTIKKYKKV